MKNTAAATMIGLVFGVIVNFTLDVATGMDAPSRYAIALGVAVLAVVGGSLIAGYSGLGRKR